MFATDATRDFKTLVIGWLEASGLGYDTRYRNYRAQFPEFDSARLARLVCDPIERYDRDWPAYRARSPLPDPETLARFVAERDGQFRREARVAIYCFDEAGIGSGVNAMRFIHEGKPVLGFYAADAARRRVNLTNVLQLEAEFPAQVKLAAYGSPEDVIARLAEWLSALGTRCGIHFNGRLPPTRRKWMSMNLADQRCIPCRGGVPPMEESRAKELLRELDDGWHLNSEAHLERVYRLQNFAQAMALANKVADIAEAEGHHPDLSIAWGQCKVEIWTHKISGLTESDFYFAAKADRAFRAMGMS